VLAGTEGAVDPFFSPDGQWIGYFAARHLKKIALSGGSPVVLCEAQPPWGASWVGDRIVYGEGPDGIFEVPATGGTPKRLVAADTKVSAFLHGPQLLPGGDAILFTIGSPSSMVDRWDTAQVVVQSLKTGERKVLVRGGTDARYVPTGHVLYAHDGVLFANAFDLSRLELVGGPTAILDGLSMSAGGTTGAVQLAIASTGAIVYPRTQTNQASTMVWRNRQGADTPINAPARPYETPRVSPDGARIAVRAIDQEDDIWIWDTKTETLTRLTFERTTDASPLWTRDGKRIVYVSSKEGAPSVYWKAADGTGQAEPLLAKPPESNGALVLNSITSDDTRVVYSVGVPSDIVVLPLQGDRQPRPVIAHPQFAERGGDVSPDGRWIAYYSDESGTFQVYVRPFPAADSGRWQVSSDGGSLPQWSPNGRELFYKDAHNRLISVSIQPGATFAFRKGAPLFDLSDAMQSVYRNWDVAPDGSRFVVVKTPRAVGAPQLTIVENWFEELKQRVPVK
jgi:serine/threonine-protein kinase